MTTELGADPTLRSNLMLVRRQKWWIAGAAVLGMAGSLALSLTSADQYSATAQLLVQPSGESTALGGSQVQVTPTDVQTDLQLITSAPVQRAVSRKMAGVPSVSAAEVAQTNVIAVTAISSAPARAALIANTYARAFVSYQQTLAFRQLTAAEVQLRNQIRSLGQQLKPLRGNPGAVSELTALANQQAVLKEQLAQIQVNAAVAPGGVEVVTPAQPPSSPSSPRPLQDALLGLVAGLIIGLAAAFLRDKFDDALSSKEDAERLGGVPVLALVPMVTSWKKREQSLVVSITQPLSPAAEAYRSLRTSLQFVRQERELRTLLVTSPAAAEGKTSTLANLGAVFAQTGERVVLVSCDLRRPRLGRFFGLAEQVGLTTVLLGQHSLSEALQPVDGHQNLWVLGAGALPPNPAELLSGPESREVFAALRAQFDLVLIDSPPLLPVTDAAVLAKDADATLLVVAAGQTKRADIERAAERLAQVNAAVVGTVLNEVTKQAGYGYESSYGYGYGPLEPGAALVDGAAVHSNGIAPAEPSAGRRHRRPRL